MRFLLETGLLLQEECSKIVLYKSQCLPSYSLMRLDSKLQLVENAKSTLCLYGFTLNFFVFLVDRDCS